MALYKLVSTRWDEPSSDREVGFVRRRRGDVFEVPEGEVDRLLRAGAIVPADAAADSKVAPTDEIAPAVEEPDEPTPDKDEPDTTPDSAPETPVVPLDRPKQAAPKPAWVAYAVSRGMDRAAAEALDKRELIAELD